jgi:uncharacterized damage-inducible protein DinB
MLYLEFRRSIIEYLNENTPRIQKCLAELSEEEVWQRPNTNSNSVGNLILHLCGNITQYVISSLGGAPDARVRDAEFAAKGGMNKAELEEKLVETLKTATAVIEQADESELLRVRTVQGFQKSGVDILVHVTEHYSYHTGQIAFWAKLLKDKDLGFYANLDLNIRN